MSDKSFFKEQKEQSLVKARIVEKYFWAWSKVIISILKRNERAGNKLKLAYIDLFAGPGRYEDGSESTPLRVLETAIRETDLQPRLLTVFNDADSNNTQSLQKQIHAIPEIAKLAHQPIIINQEVGEIIIEKLEKIGDIPILFFVDPWGYRTHLRSF